MYRKFLQTPKSSDTFPKSWFLSRQTLNKLVQFLKVLGIVPLGWLLKVVMFWRFVSSCSTTNWEVYVNWLYSMTNLYVFIFNFNVSFKDLIIFGVEVLEPHLLFGKLHSESSHNLGNLLCMLVTCGKISGLKWWLSKLW